MSQDNSIARRQARELAERPGAIPVLITLLDAGGVAEREKLRLVCAPGSADDVIRWLTVVGLVRRHGGAGSYDTDEPHGMYELTGVGQGLTGSLNALATACASAATPKTA